MSARPSNTSLALLVTLVLTASVCGGEVGPVPPPAGQTLPDPAPSAAAMPAAPCSISGSVAPDAGTKRGVEPSPWRYKGIVTFDAVQGVRVLALTFRGPGGDCACTDCASAVPPPGARPARPWPPGPPRKFTITCPAPARVSGPLGKATARVAPAVGGERTSDCNGTFTFVSP